MKKDRFKSKFWCNFIHRWSKWETYLQNLVVLQTGREFEQLTQKKQCSRCGKTEIEIL